MKKTRVAVSKNTHDAVTKNAHDIIRLQDDVIPQPGRPPRPLSPDGAEPQPAGCGPKRPARPLKNADSPWAGPENQESPWLGFWRQIRALSMELDATLEPDAGAEEG